MLMLTREQYDLIIKHLIEGRLNNREIAKMVPCNFATISIINHGKSEKVRWMYSGTFPIRKFKLLSYTEEQVVEKYEECKDVKEVGTHFRISQGTIGRILRSNGYHSRKKVFSKKEEK